MKKESKISHEAREAALKEYYNDTVTGLASLADLSFDGMKTTAHKAGLVNLSKDELNEIYNRDSAVWQGIIDKWDSTSAPEMLVGVSRYVMNLASQLSPGFREINSISNFMAGDGLAQKNQLKTTLEAAEFALPASKASIAGKIAKNGVGSAAHAIASKTGKVLNTAEGFGKNLFDATKSKVDNFGEKWLPQPSMATPEGLVLDVSKPSHSKSAPVYLSKKTDSNLGLTNNKDGVGGKNNLNNTIAQEVGQSLSTHGSDVAKSFKGTGKGKGIYGPYYEEAVKRHAESPKWYANPDESRIVSGEELANARAEYRQMLQSGELPKGHHRQGLAFGGENVPENIQFTGETTIRSSELDKLDLSFYHKNGYGKKNPKILKMHQQESGLYLFGNNPKHTEVTNFQNKILKWQKKHGLR